MGPSFLVMPYSNEQCRDIKVRTSCDRSPNRILQLGQIFILVIEKIIHHLMFYSTQVPAQIHSSCMARRAGGGNCHSQHCKPCVGQKVLQLITEMTRTRDFSLHHVDGVLFQWSKLLSDPSILPSCFKNTGAGGFLQQIGRSFALFHQLDCIHLEPHVETTSNSYRFEVLLNQALGKIFLSHPFS